MKLLFLTGSRSEWGYIRPILELCKRKKINYSICVTNMHLLNSHGLAINEIIKDGFEVDYKIFMTLDGGNHFTMAKSMGVFHLSFVDVLHNEKPNWLILAGDRNETLIGAICGAYTYTPTAHIQAGELSGNIDGMARHSIGKMVHLHFAANKDASDRLLKLGEEKFRIKNVGAPQLDDLKKINQNNFKKIALKYSFNYKNKICLVVFHPVTEEFKDLDKQIKILIKALDKIDLLKFWILPNNDAGFEKIVNHILKSRKIDTKIIKNLPRNDYLAILKNSQFIIGNSSSGIIEAPSYKIPAINIGSRQKNRLRAKNVIDVKNITQNKLSRAIKTAMSTTFKTKLKKIKNPYGNGLSSAKILEMLERTKITKKLLSKHMTY